MKQQIVLILLLFCIIACHAPNKQQEKSNNIECPKADSVVNVDETNIQQKDSLCADDRNKEKWGPWAPGPELPDTNQQRFNLPVFERESGKMVGYIGRYKDEDENKEYYVLDTLTVLGHQVISKDETDLYTNYPYVSWFIHVKELNDTAEILYVNSLRYNPWRGLYLTKGKNGSLKIIKLVEINFEGRERGKLCNEICSINLHETVRGVIDMVDLYDRLEKEGRCINCPQKYSYEEGLQFLEEGRTKFDEKEYDEEPYDDGDDDDS